MTLEQIFEAAPLVLHARIAELQAGHATPTYDLELSDATHELTYKLLMEADSLVTELQILRAYSQPTL